MAIREDETAAGAMGVNPVRFKLLAFGIGAAFAGMTGVYFVAKLQTATPEMFNFSVSSMLLVMVVLGGMGSVWGVVIGAVLLAMMQSTILPQLNGWLHALGTATGAGMLERVDLVQWTQLFFGLILIGMMLFRREGLVPAVRRTAALTFDAQHAEVARGGFLGLERLERWAPGEGVLLDIRNVTVRFGGLVALNGVSIQVPAGGVVAVIGPNGSGKSTLFNVITGLVPASGGAITFRGRELLGMAPHEVLAAGVARDVPEHPAVSEPFGVGQRDDRAACAVAERGRWRRCCTRRGMWRRSGGRGRWCWTSSGCSGTGWRRG